MGTNFGGLAYGHTEADIGVDPVLKLENVELELDTVVAKYIRTLELFGRSARVDYVQGYQEAKWRGRLDGTAAAVKRKGLSDGVVRFAINFQDAPPLGGQEYVQYRAEHTTGTVVGAAVAIRVPTGKYKNDKLLNLGGNRFVVRPQFGVSHFSGRWIAEITGEISLHGDNDDFFGGKTLEQDPLFIVHSHLIYSFRPGLWVGASAGYDYGGETTVDGAKKDDMQQNFGWGINGAYPINRTMGLKLSYVNTQTQETTGADTDTLMLSLSYMW
ncbi:MAG: hypothetical protein ACI9JM_000418 [Halioglobus sp.]|jgi:hypothetical protein